MSLFLQFAELCDALAATTKKLEKRALIASYLATLPVEDAGRAALWLAGTPFPETDPRVLIIGGSLLAKAVAQLAAAGPEAISAAYRRNGDLGAAAADLLYGHAPATASLALADVESAFAALSDARGPAPKLRLLLDLLARATPDEAKYLIKLITGDMRTGVKQSLVEEAVAEAWPPPSGNGTPAKSALAASVRRASMLLGNLAEVVALAAAGRLDDARMKLFHPLGFMLASPVQSTSEALARLTEETRTEIAGNAEAPAATANNATNAEADFPDESNAALVSGHDVSAAHVSPASRSQRGSGLVSGHDFIRAEEHARKKGASAPEGIASLGVASWQVEDKFDGIRAQLHVAPESAGAGTTRVALYSRNRDDLSESFPDLTEAFASIAEPAILDGEILAWNPSAQRALPFSALQQRLGRKRVTAEMLRDIPAVLIVFDILYRGDQPGVPGVPAVAARGGQLLLDEPLARRRAILEDFCARWSPHTAAAHAPGQATFFAPQQSGFPRLILARATHLGDRATAAAQLDQAYDDARTRGNEGVMLKSLASLYQPGRRGLAWLKLKRELATLDVVVTGVEYGNGRRAHVLSDYTFAVRDPSDPAQPLKNVGKAYSGLTDQEIADMTAWFKAHTLEDRGHFRTVEPLIVLEVAFNNVMRSSRHASGFALRFPRILRIRTDKPLAEIDTLQRVEEIYTSQPDKPIDTES